MATNKVVYGNTTLIDLTGDTAEASDVASGKIFHNKAGVQQTGTATIVTPTSITPSNSSPASMSANGIYKPTASGYAISSYSSVAPSNSSPPSLSNGSIYKPSANGYAISSYSSITPSSSGAYFSSGMIKMSSSGYAYSSKPSILTHVTTLGASLGASSTKNRTLFTYPVTSTATYKLYCTAYTNTSSNQGYISITNGSQQLYKKYLTTNKWTTFETSFSVASGYTLYFITDWDGSHTNASWVAFADLFTIS